jgi:hypothetical protein
LASDIAVVVASLLGRGDGEKKTVGVPGFGVASAVATHKSWHGGLVY